MFKEKQIRILAAAVIKKNNKILVIPGFDHKKNESFSRIIGGGVEFGEKIEEALKREIMEEIGSELENIKYLGFLENLFVFEGSNGHEIFFIYRADLKNKELYNKTEILILDSKNKEKAIWSDIKDLEQGKLYPLGILKYI